MAMKISEGTMSRIRHIIVRPRMGGSSMVMYQDYQKIELRDTLQVAKKMAYLKFLKTKRLLHTPQVRFEELPRMVRYATHRDPEVWKVAFNLLEQFYKDELNHITQEFTKDIRDSKKPRAIEFRKFVARSPKAKKEILIELLQDVAARYDALDNLAKRDLLSVDDLSSIPTYTQPTEMLENIATHPDLSLRLRRDMIFTDYLAGNVALSALQKCLDLEKGKEDEYRELIFSSYIFGFFIPSLVMLYAIENLNPSKGELMALIGFEKEHKLGEHVTDKKAAKIAKRVVKIYREGKEDYSEISSVFPNRPLNKMEVALLYKAIKTECKKAGIDSKELMGRIPVTIVNPVGRSRELFFAGAGREKERILEVITKQLIEKEMLDDKDLSELAAMASPSARYILVRHPKTRIRFLIPIIGKKGPNDRAAFVNIRNRIDERPMINWPELISWAIRAPNVEIRIEALNRPEILIEQLLSQLEFANQAIAKEIEKKGTVVDKIELERLKETCLSRLLAKLPEKIINFTRVLMAIESEKAGELEKVLASYPMRYRADIFPRKELDFVKGELAKLSPKELIERISDPKLDIRQRIALLCEESDEVALASWEYLMQNLKKLALLSKRSVITWALHSRSLALKHKIINDPEIIVEQLLALLSFTLEGLKTEPDKGRQEKLIKIKEAVIAALRERTSQKIGDFVKILLEIQRTAKKAEGFGFHVSDLIEAGKIDLINFILEMQNYLTDTRVEPIKNIYLKLLAAIQKFNRRS